MHESLGTARPWNDLTSQERNFFWGDEYEPLPPGHSALIQLLDHEAAGRVHDRICSSLPAGWPERATHFPHEESLAVGDFWGDEAGVSQVRRWLFERGIPFRREIFLRYDRNRVVQTTWKILVRYWDAFAWSVDYDMLAVDQSLQWALCFHHEDVIVFGSQIGPGSSRQLPPRGFAAF